MCARAKVSRPILIYALRATAWRGGLPSLLTLPRLLLKHYYYPCVATDARTREEEEKPSTTQLPRLRSGGDEPADTRHGGGPVYLRLPGCGNGDGGGSDGGGGGSDGSGGGDDDANDGQWGGDDDGASGHGRRLGGRDAAAVRGGPSSAAVRR